MAALPSPTLLGVERVVIACETDSGLSAAERKSLCEQLVRKAQVVTILPVSVATAADLDSSSTEIARQSEQVLLRVAVKSKVAAPGRKTLSMKVTPVRMAREITPPAPLSASASWVKVQGKWIVQGPIEAFNKLLGTGKHKLHRPIHSEL